MSQYQSNPRIGRLEVLYHIFAYLNSHMNMGHIGYDPIGLNVYLSLFNDTEDCTVFYGGVEEESPPKMTDPHGRDLSIYSFLGANHTGNVVKRHSQTGIILSIQNASIIWFILYCESRSEEHS